MYVTKAAFKHVVLTCQSAVLASLFKAESGAETGNRRERRAGAYSMYVTKAAFKHVARICAAIRLKNQKSSVKSPYNSSYCSRVIKTVRSLLSKEAETYFIFAIHSTIVAARL